MQCKVTVRAADKRAQEVGDVKKRRARGDNPSSKVGKGPDNPLHGGDKQTLVIIKVVEAEW